MRGCFLFFGVFLFFVFLIFLFADFEKILDLKPLSVPAIYLNLSSLMPCKHEVLALMYKLVCKRDLGLMEYIIQRTHEFVVMKNCFACTRDTGGMKEFYLIFIDLEQYLQHKVYDGLIGYRF